MTVRPLPLEPGRSLHEQYLELAKKGFNEPGALSRDEIWHLCRMLIFYSAKLEYLP